MVLTTFLQLLSPAHCSFCGIMLDVRKPLCQLCCALIRPVITLELPLTATRRLPVIAGGAYDGPLAHLIRAKQIQNHVAARSLGQLLAEQLVDWQQQVDCLVPVPLHWRRYAWRGFNQAELMARHIGSVWNIPVERALVRDRHTLFQSDCDARQRKENLQNAFSFALDDQQRFRGKHIVLVDDLMTTGSTLQEAAHVLLRARPASLTAVVAARVV